MVLIAMIPLQCMEPFGLASCSPTYDPVDSAGLRQRKTEHWDGITPVRALIDGRYDEQVSRPQAIQEQDCRKSQRLG
jgi:hypothetical protein